MTMPTEGCTLGMRYVDRVTQFKGTATGRAVYLTAATQVQLVRADKDGKPESLWMDEARLDPILDDVLPPGPYA